MESTELLALSLDSAARSLIADGFARPCAAPPAARPAAPGPPSPAPDALIRAPEWRRAGRRPVTDALTRRIVGGAPGAARPLPPDLGGLALGASSDFFATARKRIALVFRLNVTLAVALAFILFGGILLSISGLLAGHGSLAVASGGLSVADLLGVYAFKPLGEISSALVASQRLEILHLRLLSQLSGCAQQPDPDERLRCQAEVWNAIQRDIAAMSESVAAQRAA
jgi:hypothetical protein